MILINLELISFKIAFILCAVSIAGYLLSLLIKKIKFAKISTWILAAAFSFLTINLLFVVINSGGLINFGSRDFLSLCAWSVSGVYLVLQFKTKTRSLGAFISPFILLFMIAAAGQETGKILLPANLQSWLTAVHMFLTITGEALFILASCAGAMFIIQNGLLKNKKLSKMSRLLPSLDDLDRINYICLLWGFPVLSVGVLAGMVFAEFSWQSRMADGSENYLDFCRLDYLWISSASAYCHWLEGLSDGFSFFCSFYSSFIILWKCKILFFNFA